MIRYISKRFLRAFITLFIILSVVFILVRQMPVEGYFPNYDKMSKAQIENGIRQLGLDQPMYVQLFRFFRDLLSGDLGISRVYRNNVAVTEILAPKIPLSLQLGSLALLVSLLAGLPMGSAHGNGIREGFSTILERSLSCSFRPFLRRCITFLYQLYGTEWMHIKMLFDAAIGKVGSCRSFP